MKTMDTVLVRLDPDVSKLRNLLPLLEELNEALEKANALLGELALKSDLDIAIRIVVSDD